jgi:transposase-like protein
MRYTASMAETKDLLVRNFPPDVKEALVALADERDTNMNDVAVELSLLATPATLSCGCPRS